MSLTDKRQLLRDLSTSNGISYDKIRLQDGKSTNNTSHQMLLELAHKSLAFGPVSSGSETKTPTRNVDHAPPET